MPPFLSAIYAAKSGISNIYLALLYNLVRGLLPRFAKLSNRLMIFLPLFQDKFLKIIYAVSYILDQPIKN